MALAIASAMNPWFEALPQLSSDEDVHVVVHKPAYNLFEVSTDELRICVLT